MTHLILKKKDFRQKLKRALKFKDARNSAGNECHALHAQAFVIFNVGNFKACLRLLLVQLVWQTRLILTRLIQFSMCYAMYPVFTCMRH